MSPVNQRCHKQETSSQEIGFTWASCSAVAVRVLESRVGGEAMGRRRAGHSERESGMGEGIIILGAGCRRDAPTRGPAEETTAP